MQLHQIKPKHKIRTKKRLGRGGKRGTYSGRGVKGQKSRAGRKFQPIIRELIKRYPKQRGHRQKSLPANKQARIKLVILNLAILEKKFEKEEKVSPETLLKKGIISKIKGGLPQVKILAKGEISKNLLFENCQISKSAREKIEKSGGKINQ